jgi:transcriptional regulator with XRE-family HTH domain
MISRLQQLLQAEGINKSEFAETIGIAPATVTHLLSGRNNPSYEIICAISRHFPKISLDWLINGTGKMYRDSPGPAENAVSGGLFDARSESVAIDAPTQTPDLKRVVSEKHISKILIFFSDGTFQDIPVK